MNPKSKILFVLTAAFGISLFYNNCSDVSFSGKADGLTPQGFPPVNEILQNCEKAASLNQLSTYQQTLNFADTQDETGLAKVCPFKTGPETDNAPDQNGNFTMKNNYLRSRYEQYRALVLPAGAVVCSAQILAPQQTFLFDDMFYITYNDYILASSLKRSFSGRAEYPVEQLALNGTTIDFYKYDWSKVANQSFEGVNDKADDYCAGGDKNAGDCDWPLSQQVGKIELGFDPEVVVPVGLKASGSQHKFGFIVTGDNDPNIDCFHENVDLTIKFTYYLKN